MNTATLHALANFPSQLQLFYDAIPAGFMSWAPESWDGIPSETFTPIEQLCHVRDIEIDGYQSRIRRALSETNPFLPSIDGYAVAKAKSYSKDDAIAVLAAIRKARIETIDLISGLTDAQWRRPAVFEGYGTVTAAGLVFYLCSHDQQHLAGLQWLLGKIDAARV